MRKSLVFNSTLLLLSFAHFACKKESNSSIPKLEIPNASMSSNDAVKTLTNGLVAYYPFSGNPNDVSGNGLNGILNGTGVQLTSDRFGHKNSAYHFDGYNEILVADNPKLNLTGNMSISAWFRSDSLPLFRTGYTIVVKRQNSDFMNFPYYLSINLQYGLPTDYNTLLFATSIPPAQIQYLQSIQTMPVKKWAHVVSTISGSTLSMYLNGSLIYTSSINNALRQANNANLIIGGGARLDKPAEEFLGSIDELRLYNRALSASEVKYLAEH